MRILYWSRCGVCGASRTHILEATILCLTVRLRTHSCMDEFSDGLGKFFHVFLLVSCGPPRGIRTPTPLWAHGLKPCASAFQPAGDGAGGES